MIAPTTSIADQPHRVIWQNPGPPVPTSEGSFTQTWTDCDPPATWCKVEAATAQNLERVGVGTITTVASHLVTLPYHPQVTTASRGIFNGRLLSVTNAVDVDERHATTVAICAEVLPVSVRLHYDGLEDLKVALRQLVPESAAEAQTFLPDRAAAAFNEMAAVYEAHVHTRGLSRGLKIQVERSNRFGVSVVLKNTAPNAWLFESGTDGVARKTAKGWNRGAMPPAHAFIPPMERARKDVRRFLVELLERQGLTVTNVG